MRPPVRRLNPYRVWPPPLPVFSPFFTSLASLLTKVSPFLPLGYADNAAWSPSSAEDKSASTATERLGEPHFLRARKVDAFVSPPQQRASCLACRPKSATFHSRAIMHFAYKVPRRIPRGTRPPSPFSIPPNAEGHQTRAKTPPSTTSGAERPCGIFRICRATSSFVMMSFPEVMHTCRAALPICFPFAGALFAGSRFVPGDHKPICSS